MQLLLALLAAFALATVAVACGDDEDDAGTGNGNGEETTEASIPSDALQGASLTVGSKEFTEQLILGQITVKAMEAAGANVNDQTGLAGSVAARRALSAGEIDAYWEYTGTAWLTYMNETEPLPDAQQQFDRVAQRDERNNDITWLDPAPANNTYAFAVRSEAQEELGVQAISDFEQLIQERPDEATLCVGEEFAARDDGLPGVEEAYGFEFPDRNVTTLDDGVVYTEVDNGERCNFGSVFTTDGRIAANDLAVVEDDQQFFPVYNPALNVRSEVLEEHPQIRDVFAPIAERLDDEALQGLNAQVDVEGLTEDEVAEEWLREEGFTS